MSIVISAAVLGFILQHHKDKKVFVTHPAPGSFVEIEGRRIHFRESGEGEVTFVLETGLGGYSESWGPLESSLAEIGRVFVYDRAGLGWSEEGPHPRTAQQIATELHLALETAHVRKPFILVGHSLGGLTQSLYAMRYPDDVAGLLLIDPSHKDQMAKLPPPPAVMTFLFTRVSQTAAFGLPQLFLNSPDPVKDRTSYILTSGAEFRGFMRAEENWGDRPVDFGNTPIYVLTAGDYSRWPGRSESERKAAWEIWRSLHAGLVASSTSDIRKHVVVTKASHYIHKTDLAAVINAATELADRIKKQSPQSIF